MNLMGNPLLRILFDELFTLRRRLLVGFPSELKRKRQERKRKRKRIKKGEKERGKKRLTQ